MTDADPIPDLADARRLLDQVQAIATIGETLPLTPTDTISYAEFLEWQVRLLDILAVPETTFQPMRPRPTRTVQACFARCIR